MQYVCYELDEDPDPYIPWYEKLFYRFTKKLGPTVNPDFYDVYDDVEFWWLELDKNKIPIREIGFNPDGKAIVAAPIGNNRGLFTHCKPNIKGFYPIEMYQFVEQWEIFKEEFISNYMT